MHVVNQTIAKACFYVSEILTGKQGYNAFAYFFSYKHINKYYTCVFNKVFSYANNPFWIDNCMRVKNTVFAMWKDMLHRIFV